ncbi:MAG: hypothetical protein HY332_25440 [Chloroflexi bacterium]|nr:hypothetical protein [Chloroflexota bacterium]
MERSIRDLAVLIRELTGYHGTLRWGTTKPDGQPRRCLDTRRASAYSGSPSPVELERGGRRPG